MTKCPIHSEIKKADARLFNVGGELARFPGDPNLSAENRIGCRCTILEVFSDEADQEYWGSEQQPFWRPGPNPTVDMVIRRNVDGDEQILMIQRADDAAEGGKWALPGGFHDTDSGRGEPWVEGKETAEDAAIRELAEETGLSVDELRENMQEIGKFGDEGGPTGRDPRDNEEAWSVSTAFELTIDESMDTSQIRGLDDAQDAKWVSVKDLDDMDVAFDHRDIIDQRITDVEADEDTLSVLGTGVDRDDVADFQKRLDGMIDKLPEWLTSLADDITIDSTVANFLGTDDDNPRAAAFKRANGAFVKQTGKLVMSYDNLKDKDDEYIDRVLRHELGHGLDFSGGGNMSSDPDWVALWESQRDRDDILSGWKYYVSNEKELFAEAFANMSQPKTRRSRLFEKQFPGVMNEVKKLARRKLKGKRK